MGNTQRLAIHHTRQLVGKCLPSLGVLVLLVCTVSLLFPLVQGDEPRSDHAQYVQSPGHHEVGDTPELPVLIPSIGPWSTSRRSASSPSMPW